MRFRFCVAMAILYIGSSGAVSATAQQPQDSAASGSEQQSTVSGQQSVAATSEPDKPSSKPKKVYTNEDLKGSGANDNFGTSSAGFEHINDCNASCFDQVRAMAQVDTIANPNWRRDLLDAIELVRNDGEWQRFLRDYYTAQYKLCQLSNDRRMDLARNSDPHNVTLQEIAIAEKYDAKVKAAQDELQALRAREYPLQRKFLTNRMAYQFSTLQTMWVISSYTYTYHVQYYRH